MPLIKGKSDKSFSKNVETEMNAGKPQKQSLAIAYAVKRKAEKDKMAHGGKMCAHGKMIDQCFDEHDEMPKPQKYADGGDAGDDDSGSGDSSSSSSDSGSGPAMGGDSGAIKAAMSKLAGSVRDSGLAEGGEIHEEGDVPYNNEEKESGIMEDGDSGLIHRIMEQMAKGGKMYSKGGQVANDVSDLAGFQDNEFDDLVKSGGMSSHIESNQEHGDAQESADREDIIKKIMSSLAKKDRLPHPA